jgi:hypothetical protein
VDPDRFERIHDPSFPGGLLRHRETGPVVSERSEPADFLGRLWTLFGPPDPCDDGFEYGVRDRRTGLVFTAYSAASRPAYGGAPSDEAALGPVIDAFEALVDATPLSDCAHEYALDADAGGGRVRIGIARGRWFFETVR